jgi:hypothetical protein
MSNSIAVRPYQDEEVQAATQLIFSDAKLLQGMKAFLPTAVYDYFLKIKDEVHSIFDFQSKITYPLLMAVQQQSVTARTVSGMENVNNAQKQLFISNHRDIVLDSSFLNVAFYEHKIETCEVAIGSNLVKNETAKRIFKLNRSFVVQREGNPRELYQHSLDLSNYIFGLIQKNTASVWIAQREGRAKDGNDRTQVSLLKMLSMSAATNTKEDFIAHCRALRITPVAITYEFDPCDLLKTQEFIVRQQNPNFEKSFQQDLQNMLYGIEGKKGRVHFHFDKPLDEELEILETITNKKAQFEALAQLIDRSVHRNFKLYEINYIAHDLLHGTAYADRYSAADFAFFKNIFEEKINTFSHEWQALAREYLLGIYANPVINAAKIF